MKTRNLLFFSIVTLMTIIACKEEEETKFGSSVSPVQNVVNSIGSFTYFRDEPTVMATQFKSSKDGRITEFGIRAGKGTYTISLWDSSAQSVISSAQITASDSTVFIYKDITDVNIVSNKTYIISMFNSIAEGGSGTQVYRYGITGFPFTQGDITLVGSYYRNTPNPTAFPAGVLQTNLINGIADFKFEPEL